jgi:hypothetical protein
MPETSAIPAVPPKKRGASGRHVEYRQRQHERLTLEIVTRADGQRWGRAVFVLQHRCGYGLRRARGGMFGYGLNDEIIRDYEWLIDHYNSGDELFILGFSCGAYTARIPKWDCCWPARHCHSISFTGSLNQRLAGSDLLEVIWTSGKGEALRIDEGWSFRPR